MTGAGSGSPNLDASWPTSGAEQLDADSSSIDGFAENAAALAMNIQDDAMGPAQRITGQGEQFSTHKEFGPGQRAQAAADFAAQDMLTGLQSCHTDVRAISMASFVCSDLLEGGDNLGGLEVNTVDYAFAESGASAPGGLPNYMDGTTLHDQLPSTSGGTGETFLGQWSVPGEGGYFEYYKTDDDGFRTVHHQPDGEVVETVRDAEENTLSKTIVNTSDGTSRAWQWNASGALTSASHSDGRGTKTATQYNPDGSVASVKRQYQESTVHQDYVDNATHSTTYDEHGNVTETDVQVQRDHNDGTRQYGTMDDDGNFTVERHIEAHPEDPRPHGVTPHDQADLIDEQLERAQEDVLGN